MITTYRKHDTKTNSVIPTSKEGFLGKGCFGAVFLHSRLPNIAVKKSRQTFMSAKPGFNFSHEYEIGLCLKDLKNCVQVHNLFIKYYPDGSQKHKMTMDKIQGTTLKQTSTLSSETIQSLIEQAATLCLQLFDRGIYWSDLHDENIYICTDQKRLILADFEGWEKSDDPTITASLLRTGLCSIIEEISRYCEERAEKERILAVLTTVSVVRVDPSLKPGQDLREWTNHLLKNLSVLDKK